MDRKEFFSKAFVGGSLLFLAPAVITSCAKASDPASVLTNNSGPISIDLNSNSFSTLKSVGGYAYSGNIIIIRTSQTNYTALSKICTHQGCTVGYNSSANKLACPCHGAAFSTGGSVLQGPASKPLTSYNVTVNGTSLTIS